MLDLLAVAVPMALGLWHVRGVAPHYHFGSFDDDASYVLGAKAIVHGVGLTGTLSDGRPLVGYYPPGFSAVLAPLVAIFGTSASPLRTFAVVAFAAIFPVTWWYLGRCGVGRLARVATLLLLALNPVLATYGSMVMAETTFVVVFMVWLVVVRRYDTPAVRTLSLDALGVVVAGAGLIWLKQAAIGMVAGLVLWLVIRRAWRKAAVVTGGVGLLLLPVIIARRVVGVPLSGARYSMEFGQFYDGGLWHRVSHTVPVGAWDLVSQWIPVSLLPDGSPFIGYGFEHDVVVTAGLVLTALVVIGMVEWWRKHRDPTLAIVVVYLGEVVVYPFINERRTVLFLPVLAAWSVLGGAAVVRPILAGCDALVDGLRAHLGARTDVRGVGATGRRRRRGPGAVVGAAVVVAVVAGSVVVPLSRQFHRDYLFAVGQSSSQPEGSPYMGILRSLGVPTDVVETDYVSTVALFSGHRGDDTAFVASNGSVPGITPTCDQAQLLADLHTDHAAYLLTGALNKPGIVDSNCLLAMAADSSWGVRLLTTSVDGASVFELIGPGTPHPDLVDVTNQAALNAPGGVGEVPLGPQGVYDNPGDILTTPTVNGTATLTWTWASPVTLTQVSVGGAAVVDTTNVAVQEQRPGGAWVTVAAAPGRVGDGGVVPFLLASSPQGEQATALRVVIHGSGSAGVVDVRALGPG